MNWKLLEGSGSFYYRALSVSGMDDLFLKRVLFECIRDSLERTDVCRNHFIANDCLSQSKPVVFYDKSLCSFFTSPYTRVHTF